MLRLCDFLAPISKIRKTHIVTYQIRKKANKSGLHIAGNITMEGKGIWRIKNRYLIQNHIEISKLVPAHCW